MIFPKHWTGTSFITFFGGGGVPKTHFPCHFYNLQHVSVFACVGTFCSARVVKLMKLFSSFTRVFSICITCFLSLHVLSSLGHHTNELTAVHIQFKQLFIVNKRHYNQWSEIWTGEIRLLEDSGWQWACVACPWSLNRTTCLCMFSLSPYHPVGQGLLNTRHFLGTPWWTCPALCLTQVSLIA